MDRVNPYMLQACFSFLPLRMDCAICQVAAWGLPQNTGQACTAMDNPFFSEKKDAAFSQRPRPCHCAKIII